MVSVDVKYHVYLLSSWIFTFSEPHSVISGKERKQQQQQQTNKQNSAVCVCVCVCVCFSVMNARVCRPFISAPGSYEMERNK